MYIAVVCTFCEGVLQGGTSENRSIRCEDQLVSNLKFGASLTYLKLTT